MLADYRFASYKGSGKHGSGKPVFWAIRRKKIRGTLEAAPVGGRIVRLRNQPFVNLAAKADSEP